MAFILTTIFFCTIVVISYTKKKKAAELENMNDYNSYPNIGLTMCDGKKEDKNIGSKK